MKKSFADRYSLGLIFLGFFMFLVGSQASQSPDANSTPKVGTVKVIDLVQKVTVSGTVMPNKKTVISAPYNGYLKKIFVRVGEEVKANSPIVTVVQSLRGPDDDAYPIRAPFTGVVVQVLKTEGEYVEQGKDTSSIVRIDDTTKMFVLADVPESEIDKIKVGLPADIKTTASQSKTYKGIIREISQAAKDKSQNSRWGEHVDFTIKIEVTDKDEQVKGGMSTLVDILVNRRPSALALRHEYVQHSKDQYFVTLADGVRRDVKVGLQNEEFVEIESGLKENDRVQIIDFLSLSNQE